MNTEHQDRHKFLINIDNHLFNRIDQYVKEHGFIRNKFIERILEIGFKKELDSQILRKK